ncbi:MAG: hypothetical protein QY321_01980 [Patescibacteria group bacterium]|nr:MAG: hypothetical protein QY321_01980 [Patescibacteria group bacterium]
MKIIPDEILKMIDKDFLREFIKEAFICALIISLSFGLLIKTFLLTDEGYHPIVLHLLIYKVLSFFLLFFVYFTRLFGTDFKALWTRLILGIIVFIGITLFLTHYRLGLIGEDGLISYLSGIFAIAIWHIFLLKNRQLVEYLAKVAEI